MQLPVYAVRLPERDVQSARHTTVQPPLPESNSKPFGHDFRATQGAARANKTNSLCPLIRPAEDPSQELSRCLSIKPFFLDQKSATKLLCLRRNLNSRKNN